ncbi:hypothetical protein [Fusobacterium necrophorum]|jgi:hypothetical protein|uniref:hypothetical protein n=1 Tax=Fusobacterium necrophorum TaxID=859 RepID=UPI000D11C4D0|nr:hypothetical protein [Fusobacterium necrophorum]AVQ21526.1 hypothetical protein C4N15_07620 [Fusobacterium necrophorum subsp. funduliforme]MDK4523192.1 hypothetical protein [Fusobacterium necrophorum]
MIKFNDVEYHLYEVRGYDHFLCEDLKKFAWLNRVEFKFCENEVIPEKLEELKKIIEEVNAFFKKKKQNRGWYLISKDDDEASIID